MLNWIINCLIEFGKQPWTTPLAIFSSLIMCIYWMVCFENRLKWYLTFGFWLLLLILNILPVIAKYLK